MSLFKSATHRDTDGWMWKTRSSAYFIANSVTNQFNTFTERSGHNVHALYEIRGFFYKALHYTFTNEIFIEASNYLSYGDHEANKS